MPAMPRLSGSAAALIAALASYRPMPSPSRHPADAEFARAQAERRAARKALARPNGRQRRR